MLPSAKEGAASDTEPPADFPPPPVPDPSSAASPAPPTSPAAAKAERGKPGDEKKKRELLDKIARFEARGAILATDAHTLRLQLLDCLTGSEWRAAEKRLEQLALSWNPYQDMSAADRSTARKPGKPSKRPKKKRDFYELLGLTGERSKLSTDDIKRQFRKLALRLHPDKQQAAAAKLGDELSDEAIVTEGEESKASADEPADEESIEFARLLVAYETLSDPERRAAYDAKLADLDAGKDDAESGEVVGMNQIKLEASTDFASLEWMARVKHKMDVMDRIAEWAKILGINATEIRFETGEPCVGRGCGKIVSMDRDLECYGSPRRRVYVCLLHKYIHACDELCTSQFGDAELDKKVCPMRAYWLVQNWLYDQLQAKMAMTPATNEVKMEVEVKQERSSISTIDEPMLEQKSSTVTTIPDNDGSPVQECLLAPSDIHLGDYHTRFHLDKLSECRRENCSTLFQFLEDGIFACRRHGTPHICTFEQCDRKELDDGRYVCWVSGRVYGSHREEAGTGVRMRKIVYSDANGDENAVEMEVPVMLPLGKMTSYLLEGHSGSHKQDISSLSPPPPDEKARHGGDRLGRRPRENSVDGYDSDDRSPRRVVKRVKTERETSPVRARIHKRLAEKVQKSEETAFFIYLKVPPAVANLPRVALELQDTGDVDDEDDEDGPPKNPERDLLPIRVHARHTVNYIKYWMEGLTDQQISIWDQQVFWSDTVIGEEANVMMLEEHGIHAGCVLELRLHDDCPLLVSAWNGQQAGGGQTSEYNTVQISKEAEEEQEDRQEEWENVIAVEEEAFERDTLDREREKMERLGVLNHTEVIQFDGKTPRLLGVIPTNSNAASQRLLTGKGERPNADGLVKIDQNFVEEAATKQREALRAMAGQAERPQPARQVRPPRRSRKRKNVGDD